MIKTIFNRFLPVLIVPILFLLVFAGLFSSKVYKDKGGDRMVVDSTGILDVKTGGLFVFGGDTLAIIRTGWKDVATDSCVYMNSAAVASVSPIDSASVVWAFITDIGQSAGDPNPKLIRAWCPDDDSLMAKIDMDPGDSVKLSFVIWR